MSLDNVSSSNIQANVLNQIINEINALESGGPIASPNLLTVTTLNVTLTATMFNALSPNLSIIFAYVRGTNYCWIIFGSTLNVNPATLTQSINGNIVTSAQWDSVAPLIPPGQTNNRPVALVQAPLIGYPNVTGLQANSYNRVFFGGIFINATGVINLRLSPMSGTFDSTVTTITSLAVQPILVRLTRNIP